MFLKSRENPDKAKKSSEGLGKYFETIFDRFDGLFTKFKGWLGNLDGYFAQVGAGNGGEAGQDKNNRTRNNYFTKFKGWLGDLDGYLAQVVAGKGGEAGQDKNNRTRNNYTGSGLPEIPQGREIPDDVRKVLEMAKREPDSFKDVLPASKTLSIGDSNGLNMSIFAGLTRNDPSMPFSASYDIYRNNRCDIHKQRMKDKNFSWAVSGSNSVEHRKAITRFLDRLKSYKRSGLIERAQYTGGANNGTGTLTNRKPFYRNLWNIEQNIADLTSVFGRGNVVISTWPFSPRRDAKNPASAQCRDDFNGKFITYLKAKYGVKVLNQHAADGGIASNRVLHPKRKYLLAEMAKVGVSSKGDPNIKNSPSEYYHSYWKKPNFATEYQKFMQEYKRHSGQIANV